MQHIATTILIQIGEAEAVMRILEVIRQAELNHKVLNV